MQRSSRAGLTNLLYGVALDMLLGLHSLCIHEGATIAEPWAAFCPQQAGNGDAVNRRFRSSIFHTRKDSTEQADSTRKWLFSAKGKISTLADFFGVFVRPNFGRSKVLRHHSAKPLPPQNRTKVTPVI